MRLMMETNHELCAIGQINGNTYTVRDTSIVLLGWCSVALSSDHKRVIS